MFLSGVIVGLCFDLYRIIRWKMGLNRVITFLGDIFFSLVALLIIFYLAQKANYLEWRFYLFAGSLLGLIMYLILLSRYITKLFNRFLNYIVQLIKLIIKMFEASGRNIINLIAFFMAIPYGILRWIGLLLFRIGESVAVDTATKVRRKTTKNPKQ
ncbi:MAG: spore cortex biosynthesis protein YabQ [Peptococcaceae bacterium]|nr:spore cortex biosynthesis protein YabQ [Peptococcaceae bacterium]